MPASLLRDDFGTWILKQQKQIKTQTTKKKKKKKEFWSKCLKWLKSTFSWGLQQVNLFPGEEFQFYDGVSAEFLVFRKILQRLKKRPAMVCGSLGCQILSLAAVWVLYLFSHLPTHFRDVLHIPITTTLSQGGLFLQLFLQSADKLKSTCSYPCL